MLKKIVAGSLCAVMLIGNVAFAAPSFDDVDEQKYSWAVTPITEMANAGIINGFEDGTFRPANGVTRIDSLLLISRILGANDEENKEVMEFAQEMYFPYVNVLKYPAYEKNLSYILYRKMFTTSELNLFLSSGKGGESLKRYEAAELLTRMSGNADAVKNIDTSKLTFADTSDIPKTAQPYVYYCYKNGLMKGVENNKFDPNGIVTRAQMAVMLYNAMNTYSFSLVSATVNEVSGFKNSIAYTTDADETNTIYNTGDFRITYNGEDIDDIDVITSGDTLNIHYSGEKVILAEAIGVLKDETVTGIYSGKGASSTYTKLLMRPEGSSTNSETKDYIVSDDVRVYIGDDEAKLSDLKIGDIATLTIRDSRVTIINVAERERTVSGYINAFDYSGLGSIDVKFSDNSIETYKLTDDTVKVYRNKEKATLRDLKVGDKVQIDLEYDKIVAINATSTIKKYDGTIEEIVISKNPTIKINIGDEVIECAMDNEIEVTINGKEAEVYDMRLGYTAKITTDSSTITSIAITSTPAVDNLNVMGTVLEVNTNYASVTLQVDEDTTTQIFIKKNATILNGTTGKAMTLSAIKEGDILTAVVSTSGFTSEAISIVVLQQK